jgi:polysaccharide export outer membrane protein
MISVRPEPEIARQVTVRPDGRISFDLIGDLAVQGKTVDEVRREVTARMAEFIVHPDVIVILSQSNSRKYFMFGEIRRPGSYPLIGHVSALQALASAGGPTRFSNLDEARLVRPTEGQSLTYSVDFEEITKRGDATTDYELQPGDIVYVPPNIFARIGYALGVVLFPFQQIVGLGSRVVRGY